MRPSTWASALVAALLQLSFGAAVDQAPNRMVKRAVTGASDKGSKEDTSTLFNGVTVPAIKELPGVGFEEAIKDGYWYVSIGLARLMLFLTLRQVRKALFSIVSSLSSHCPNMANALRILLRISAFCPPKLPRLLLTTTRRPNLFSRPPPNNIMRLCRPPIHLQTTTISILRP